MKFNGILKFNDDGTYNVYDKHRTRNNCLNKELDTLYKEEKTIHIKIISYYNKVIFNETGLLEYRNDLGGRLYRLWIGGKCLDDILWDNVDKDVTVGIYEVVEDDEKKVKKYEK